MLGAHLCSEAINPAAQATVRKHRYRIRPLWGHGGDVLPPSTALVGLGPVPGPPEHGHLKNCGGVCSYTPRPIALVKNEVCWGWGVQASPHTDWD